MRKEPAQEKEPAGVLLTKVSHELGLGPAVCAAFVCGVLHKALADWKRGVLCFGVCIGEDWEMGLGWV